MKRKKIFIVTLIATFLLITMVGKGQSVSLKAYLVNISGDSTLSVDAIVNSNELKPMSKTFTIVSFYFVMANTNHDLVTISNEGQKFNKKTLDALKLIKHHGTIFFDEIWAINSKGQRKKLDTLVINAL